VWWDWKRWEKEIDWMALQGINLPLAFTGQEAIWQKVFKSFNVTDRDLDNFFGGPAFLAWARMGNLHGWGGPLSQNWLDQQLALQKKILSRMIELGMVPVLPSFSGNVPAVFSKLFPSANITRLGDWNTVDADPRWCCTYLLGPSDALFIEVGQAFIKQQIKEYGDVTNIYNWYVRLICFFGISPECMCDCSVSFACWVTRFCYQLLLVGMVYLSLLTNEF
jgi:alpha-N-acetylglucosaminidase